MLHVVIAAVYTAVHHMPLTHRATAVPVHVLVRVHQNSGAVLGAALVLLNLDLHASYTISRFVYILLYHKYIVKFVRVVVLKEVSFRVSFKIRMVYRYS